MLQEQSFQRPIILHALFVGFILTILGGVAAITMQQMLRRGADQPQIEMADLYVSKMNAGEKLNDFLPLGRVDLRQSLEPFVIFYNDKGEPEGNSGYLNQTAPVPPPGVFTYLRSHGADKFTWQPTTDVRIAAVGRRVTGKYPGFLLVGRSLRLVEESESLLRRMVFLGWFILLLLLTSGAAFLHRARRYGQIAFP